MSAVMAVLDFHGDSAELAARYDKAVHDVVAVSSARPLGTGPRREYGFMVVDVDLRRGPAFVEEATRSAASWRGRDARVQAAHLPGAQPRWPVEAMPADR